MAHVAPQKKETVSRLVDYFTNYDIVGVADMNNLPAAQANKIRGNLRGKVEVFMTKKRLMKIAIDQLKDQKPGLQALKDEIKGMAALAFTKENPFAVYKTLKKSKSPAPAKEGQIAPRDITVPAGPTPFAPGPVISELAQLGIKSKVQDGKIAIVSDTTVIKEGETFSANLASMLTRLSIFPMEIGLNLSSIYEKGVVYPRSVLDIDEDKFMSDIMQAATEAFNLTVEAAYPTKDNVELLLQKVARETKALAKESKFLTSETVDEVLGQAEREMNALVSEAKIDLNATPAPKAEEKPAEPKAEEAKTEETKEEVKEETKSEDN